MQPATFRVGGIDVVTSFITVPFYHILRDVVCDKQESVFMTLTCIKIHVQIFSALREHIFFAPKKTVESWASQALQVKAVVLPTQVIENFILATTLVRQCRFYTRALGKSTFG